MPERSIRALIALIAVIVVAWLGAAAAARLDGTRGFWPAVVVTVLLIGGIIAYGVYHAMRGRHERIERGTHQGSRLRKGTEPRK